MLVSFTRVLLVTALAVSSLAAPDIHSPTRTSRNAAAPINPVGVVARSLARNPAVYLTNAQRLSRGLPPNRPRAHARRALRQRRLARPGATLARCASLARFGERHAVEWYERRS